MRVFILILVISPLLSFGQEIITLKQAIDIAIEQNFNIKIAQNNIEKAKVQHHIGNAGILPTVSASSTLANKSFGRVEQNTERGETIFPNAKSNRFAYSITATQTLFDGKAMFYTYDKLGKLAEIQDLQKAENVENVITQVISSYLDLLKGQNTILTLQEAILLSQERLEIATKKVKAGAATKIEVLNAKVDLANDSSSLIETQRIIGQSKHYLNYLLGLPTNQSQKVYQDKIIIHDNLINNNDYNSIATNVLIKKANKNEAITQLDYQLYKAAKLPKLYISGSFNHSKSISDYGFANKSISDQIAFSLTASYTIFQGFQRNIQLQTAKIDQINQQIVSKDIRANISRDLVIAKDNFKSRLNQLKLEQNNLETFNENYRRSKQLYEFGKVSSIQIREAQLNLINAKKRLFDAVVNTKLEEIEILRLTGNLLSVSD